MLPDEYDDKPKQSHRSRSPVRVPRDRSDHSEPRKGASELTIICGFQINLFVFTLIMLGYTLCSDSLNGVFPPRSSCVIIVSPVLKEVKPEIKDLLADLQDISDTERKTSTAESSIGNGLYKLEF